MLKRLVGAWLAFVVMTTLAVAATILPPAETTFFDSNGNILSLGSVYFYIPGTLTPKSTYQNSAQTVSNTNPVALDASGRAIIYGSGAYREIVKDVSGNLIWDQITSDTSVSGISYAGTAGGTANALIISDGSFTAVDGQQFSFLASATNTGATTIYTTATSTPVPVDKNSTSGQVQLTGGEIRSGNMYTVVYSQTLGIFVLINPVAGTTNFDVTNFGAISGAAPSVNNTAFQSAFTAAANGGYIHVPCGTYELTATPTVTIAAGAHVELAGDGSDCAVIYMSGAVNGPTFNFTNQWSSARTANLTIKTDQVGGTNCLVWTGSFTNADPALSAGSSIENVTLRGNDTYGAATEYCGGGFVETSITNIAIINLTYNGISSRAGIPISLNGAASANSDHINISHSNWDACATAVYYGDYVQGVQMTLDNVTGCTNGVVTSSSSTTSLSGLLISSSQFDTFGYGVHIADTAFPNLQLSNNQFIVEANSVGVRVQGSNWVIDKSNEFNGDGTTGNVGVIVDSTSGPSNGGTVTGQFLGLATGIQVLSAYTATVNIDAPYFQNNTADYSLNGSTMIVRDTYPRALSVITTQIPCSSKTRGSTAIQADGGTPTYLATATSGSAEIVPLACNGTNWQNH